MGSGRIQGLRGGARRRTVRGGRRSRGALPGGAPGDASGEELHHVGAHQVEGPQPEPSLRGRSQNEIQRLDLARAVSGDFTLEYDGQGPVTIDVGQDDAATATNIELALNALAGVTVSVGPVAGRSGVLDIEFAAPVFDVALLELGGIENLAGDPFEREGEYFYRKDLAEGGVYLYDDDGAVVEFMKYHEE